MFDGITACTCRITDTPSYIQYSMINDAIASIYATRTICEHVYNYQLRWGTFPLLFKTGLGYLLNKYMYI